jgi:hypothetical protein
MGRDFMAALGGVFCGDFPQEGQKGLTTEDTESTEVREKGSALL